MRLIIVIALLLMLAVPASAQDITVGTIDFEGEDTLAYTIVSGSINSQYPAWGSYALVGSPVSSNVKIAEIAIQIPDRAVLDVLKIYIARISDAESHLAELILRTPVGDTLLASTTDVAMEYESWSLAADTAPRWVGGDLLVIRSTVTRASGSHEFNTFMDSIYIRWTYDPYGEVADDEWYSALDDANNALGGLNNPLTAPDGTPLLPTVNWAMIFGYAKWLISPGAADELAGPFAGIFIHLGIFLAMRFALIVVYIVVFLAVYLIKWVVWLFKFLLTVIGAISGLIDLVGGVLGKGVGWLVKFVGG